MRAALGVLVAVLWCAALSVTAVHAQGAFEQFGAATQLSATPLPIIVARLIRAFIGVLGIIAVVIIIFAGFRYMTSGGDVDKTSSAKRMLVQAVVGLVIILSSFAIAQFVLNALTRASGIGGGITARDAGAFLEPLSGSLGAGIVADHYPPRNALDIPRNVRIFVTFKEAIDPATVNADTVKVFPTAEGDGSALGTSDLAVTFDDARRSFVFDPVPLLGNADTDTTYSVFLTPDINKADGRPAFEGGNGDGYAWDFEVSTLVDLTPPKVVSVIPSGGTAAPNTAVQISFDEPMDPVASTGVQDAVGGSFFDHIEVQAGAARTAVDGEFRIGNGYRTVEFVPLDACGQDRCGDIVFCLPFDEQVRLLARAATLSSEPPQALLVGAAFDGLTDASGNSLDGDGDGTAQGKGNDDYSGPAFQTGSTVDDRTPEIVSISPDINEGDVDVNRDVTITFSMPMLASSLNGAAVQLWPDPSYEMSFVPRSENLNASGQVAASDEAVVSTRADIWHPTFLPPDVEGGPYSYYPLVTRGVKGINQFCLYPAFGPQASGAGSCATEQAPYCCNGSPSATACQTVGGQTLPPAP
ncbi:hypothetical protein A2856_03730 [Candidatus Uhrbacteria bacterium RIFCSPHIGHO2_01_FULL_63_20]|uniref:SbsA Ig-like domain-containing protein n=1 Tax=Candidatus Uhrbacteria bacterium RIFCSPHIGHO2_01_FULL_63_20 TaxID=1802385 RepID=A0A1F7TME2_9BACT|nr:MAG: hypothetical protein A2856_03730 [Candidatus Uhrbacteria bacterium RIFCSPHIGHO2_01_FULL_63_20]